MVALARLPWPRALMPEFIPMARATGPLTTRTGPTNQVVASTPCMLNSSVHTASTAASTTGRYSGRHPAMTALIATFSTVAGARVGRHDRHYFVGRPAGAVEHGQDPPFGGRYDGKTVGPAPVPHGLQLVLQLTEGHPTGPQLAGPEANPQGLVHARVEVSGTAARSVLRQPGTKSGHTGEGFPLRPLPADDPVFLLTVLDVEQGRDSGEIEVPGHLQVPVVEDRRHAGRKGRVVLRVHRQAGAQGAGQLGQHRFDGGARRAVPLDDRDHPIGKRHRHHLTRVPGRAAPRHPQRVGITRGGQLAGQNPLPPISPRLPASLRTPSSRSPSCGVPA